MKRSLKYLLVVLLVPAAVSAAPPVLTSLSDRMPAPEGAVQDEAGIALEHSIWKPSEGIREDAASTTSARWLRPPHSALLWLPGDPAWSNGANEWLAPRRQLEW